VGPSQKLSIVGEMEVELREDNPIECLIDPDASLFPFQYAPEEQVELIHYRLPSYPYEGPKLQQWLTGLYRPGQTVGTFELLEKLNTRIYHSFAYAHRDDPGVMRGSGSCRDFAIFMMEAARHWGFGARFVTGYIQMAEGQHGATHAWTEIYIPGAGWRGFDPTNNKLAGNEHVSVAVAREQEKASPVSGVWDGPASAFSHMEISVQVFPWDAE
jgi:Transglutaminase-like superfamily